MTFASIKNRFQNSSALAKNSAVLFLGTMGANVLNYVFHLVIGRIVSVEIYGETESLISLVNIISVPALTLAMVATKYASSCKAEGDKKGSLEIWKYLNKKIIKYGLPLFLITVIATPYAGKFLNIQNNFALIIIWLLMLLSFFAAVNSGMLQGWQKFKYISLVGVWGAVVKLIFGVVLVKAGFGLSGIVGSFMLASLAAYLVSSLAFKFIVIGKEDKGGVEQCETVVDFQSLKRYITPVLMGNLAITILGNADMVLAKHNLGALAAGQYGALTVVSKIIFFATSVIAAVLFSMSAENHHKKSDTDAIFKNASYLILAISLGAIVFYFSFPEFILGMLFGNKYTDVAGYLGWFAIMVALFSYVNLIFQYLLSIHKTRIAYSLLVISLVFGAAVLFLGKDIYGILKIVMLSQIAGILAGLYFIYRGKRHKYEGNPAYAGE